MTAWIACKQIHCLRVFVRCVITTDSLFNITEAVSFWAEYKRMSMLYPTLREKKDKGHVLRWIITCNI